MMGIVQNVWLKSVVAAVLALAPISFSGCDREEEILDIETPEGELEVDRDLDTGEIETETE